MSSHSDPLRKSLGSVPSPQASGTRSLLPCSHLWSSRPSPPPQCELSTSELLASLCQAGCRLHRSTWLEVKGLGSRSGSSSESCAMVWCCLCPGGWCTGKPRPAELAHCLSFSNHLGSGFSESSSPESQCDVWIETQTLLFIISYFLESLGSVIHGALISCCCLRQSLVAQVGSHYVG